MVYRIEGDTKYLGRCWAELDAATRFPDWGPCQFLDTAEMTAAFAIAYDWLYDAWTEQQRKVIRESIINRGLKPGLAAYTTQRLERRWTDTHPGSKRPDFDPEAVGAIVGQI